MRAVLNKMMTPSMILKVPGLLIRFQDAFLTDLSIEQLTGLGLCFLNKFDSNNLKTHTIPSDLLTSNSVFIPTYPTGLMMHFDSMGCTHQVYPCGLTRTRCPHASWYFQGLAALATALWQVTQSACGNAVRSGVIPKW